MSALLIQLDPAEGQERMAKIMKVAKLLSHHAKEFSLTDAEKKTFIDAIRTLSVVATAFRKYYFYKVHPEAATDEIKRMMTATETKYKGLKEENLQLFLKRAKSIVGKEREKRKEPKKEAKQTPKKEQKRVSLAKELEKEAYIHFLHGNWGGPGRYPIAVKQGSFYTERGNELPHHTCLSPYCHVFSDDENKKIMDRVFQARVIGYFNEGNYQIEMNIPDFTYEHRDGGGIAYVLIIPADNIKMVLPPIRKNPDLMRQLFLKHFSKFDNSKGKLIVKDYVFLGEGWGFKDIAEHIQRGKINFKELAGTRIIRGREARLPTPGDESAVLKREREEPTWRELRKEIPEENYDKIDKYLLPSDYGKGPIAREIAHEADANDKIREYLIRRAISYIEEQRLDWSNTRRVMVLLGGPFQWMKVGSRFLHTHRTLKVALSRKIAELGFPREGTVERSYCAISLDIVGIEKKKLRELSKEDVISELFS